MRFAADRAEAHRAGGETLDDLISRFNFVQRDAGAVSLEVHQPAQGQQPLILVIDLLSEEFVLRRIVAAHGVLQA